LLAAAVGTALRASRIVPAEQLAGDLAPITLEILRTMLSEDLLANGRTGPAGSPSNLG
jgi:hypothetical protein